MGAFFLYKLDQKINSKAVANIFRKKGFSKPNIFHLNNMTLWLFKKQLINDINYIISDDGPALFASGTIIYKGKSYKESLMGLLEDFKKDQINSNELIGSFCLIFFKDNKINLLTDKSDLFHLFIDSTQTILSSSFLAVLSAHNKKVSLNKYALLEQLTVGYVIPPDTIISEINFLDRFQQKKCKNPYFSFIQLRDSELESNYYIRDFNECVKKQLDILGYYFRQINSLSSEYGIDFGLSGGYDSRFIMLLSLCYLKNTKISTHTHGGKVHTKEIEIARFLAQNTGLPLKCSDIQNVQYKNEKELIENFEDALYYYDGRPNQSMGTYSDVHTRKYRIKTLDKNRLGLNGLGGEIFRNHQRLFYNRMDIIEWFKYHVMNPYIANSFTSNDELRDLIDYVLSKAFKIIGIKKTGYIDKSTVHKYYGEIWTPFGRGIKNNVDNQLAFFLTPFAEWQVRKFTYRIIPHIGLGGKFESAMINKLNPEIAKIKSHYGFGLDREPLSYRLKILTKCIIPDRIKNILQKSRRSFYQDSGLIFDKMYEKHSIIKRNYETLKSLNMPLNWNSIIQNRTDMERVLFIGYFLNEFQGKIKI